MIFLRLAGFFHIDLDVCSILFVDAFILIATDSPQYHLPELRGRHRQTQTKAEKDILEKA